MPIGLNTTLAGMSYVVFDGSGSCGTTQADPEVMLTAFDNAGLDIILSIEPGNANITQLATKILNKYKNHPSVKGFGLDEEWFKGTGGYTMTATEATQFTNAIKAVNPAYKVTIKHYDNTKLPRNISGVTYLTDSCGFASYTEAITDYVAWANYFKGSEVAYQIGYDNSVCDTESIPAFWQALGPLPYGYGNATIDIMKRIKAQVNNSIYAVYWVDFSILTQFPLNYTGVNIVSYKYSASAIKYNITEQKSQPPTWAQGWQTFTSPTSAYTNTSTSNNVYYSLDGSGTTTNPELIAVFNFTPTYHSDINKITSIQVIGEFDSPQSGGTGEVASFNIANFSTSTWTQIEATTRVAEVTRTAVYTSGFSDIIQNGQLVLLFESSNTDANEKLIIDYAQVIVNSTI
jgi:hypothetical protein